MALISVTLLSITYGPLTAIAILMPMLIVCDVIALFLNRKHFEYKILWSIAPYSLLGVIIGTILFKFINLSMISIFIGSISLLYVLLNYLIADNFWGALAGFTSFVLHSGGLPLNIYFMSIYNKKVQFVAGVVFSIALINLFKLIPYFYLEILNFEKLYSYLIFSPIAVIGVNIVDARTYTTRDGFATAVISVQNKNEEPFEAQFLKNDPYDFLCVD